MKFRSGNLLENGNENRQKLPCGELLWSLIIDCSKNFQGLSSLQGDLLYSSPGTLSLVYYELQYTLRLQQFPVTILVGKLTSSTEPAGFALPAGGTSVDSCLEKLMFYEPGMFI